MKSFSFLLSLILYLAVFSRCCSDDIITLNEPIAIEKEAQDSAYSYEMIFDSPKPSYDADVNTRATDAGVWEDGDEIFIQFSNSGTAANAIGTYNASTKKWSITCNQELTQVTNANCKIAFAQGKNPTINANYVIFSYMTAYYRTDSGKYSWNGNVISISATLEKQGSRMRFKGTKGTKITVYGKSRLSLFYNIYTSTNVYDAEIDIQLTVGDNGYTDYFVVKKVNPECSYLSIKNETTGIVYCRPFTENTISTGNSYYYTIPTASNLHGWTNTGESPGISDDHEYVDLGLPSGLKWATCNVGANFPEEYGDYFAWGETEPKEVYSWETYKWCSGSQNTMTKYCTSSSYGTVDNKTTLEPEDDAAHVNWGGSWRMPTETEQRELLDKCIWTWTTQNEVKGYMVKGPNGNSIFFLAAGYRNDDNLNNVGFYGDYWSSSLYSSVGSSAYYLYFRSGSYKCRNSDRYQGRTVRPVCQQD